MSRWFSRGIGGIEGAGKSEKLRSKANLGAVRGCKGRESGKLRNEAILGVVRGCKDGKRSGEVRKTKHEDTKITKESRRREEPFSIIGGTSPPDALQVSSPTKTVIRTSEEADTR